MVFVAASLAVLAACWPLAASTTVKMAAESRKLLKLADMLNEGTKPSVQDVIDAYQEYVHLYDIQEKLAQKFKKAISEAERLAADDEYKRISTILDEDAIHPIANHLFIPLLGNTDEVVKVTEELREQIQEKIDHYDEEKFLD